MLALLPAAAQQQHQGMQPGNTGKSDWETEQEKRDWREAEVPPPPPAGAGGLLPFFVSSASEYRFFVDAASIAPGSDGVVRYTLVVRSPLGAETVTYEGIRCAASEVKTYATARPDGSWSVRPGNWRRIEARSVQRWHYVLAEEFFCPRKLAIRSNPEGVNALKRGGHPDRIAIPTRGF